MWQYISNTLFSFVFCIPVTFKVSIYFFQSEKGERKEGKGERERRPKWFVTWSESICNLGRKWSVNVLLLAPKPKLVAPMQSGCQWQWSESGCPTGMSSRNRLRESWAPDSAKSRMESGWCGFQKSESSLKLRWSSSTGSQTQVCAFQEFN